MAEWVKVIVAQADNLSLIPGPHMVEGQIYEMLSIFLLLFHTL